MANKLIGNNRIGSEFCLPLPPSPAGQPIENEIWQKLLLNPNRWHYIDIELNLNKYTDLPAEN